MTPVELAAIARDLKRHLAWQAEDGRTTVMRSASTPSVSQTAGSSAPRPPARATAAPAPTAAPRPAATAAPSPGPKPLLEVAPSRAPAAASAELPPMTLDETRRFLGDCKRCNLCSGRTQIVFGVGNPRAELVFVGEGPGAEEDAQGVPFVGKAGQLLTKMIEAMQFKRDDVYICNVVKCRPPNNRNPEPEEISACEPFLRAQLRAIQPKVIVGLGKFAVQTLLGEPTAITRVRGQWREYQGVPLMPTFHPAYLLRNPADKKLAWDDLQQVMKRFGKART